MQIRDFKIGLRPLIILTVLTILFAASTFGQITIKEKLGITPGVQAKDGKRPQMVFLYQFSVTTDIDTLSVLDTAHIQVVFWSLVSHSELPLDSNTPLTFLVDSTSLVSFIDPAGNVVSSPLLNVKYGDARNGKVRLVPNVVQDTTSLKFINVAVADDSTTGGEQVCIAKLRLNFLSKQRREIWPFIDDTSKGSKVNGYSDTLRIAVRGKNPSGKNLKNVPVKIQTSFVRSSGGHIHSTSLDTCPHPPDSLGRFWRGGVHYNPIINVLTDTSGIAKVDSFTASPFSGKYIITSKLIADTTVIDTMLLYVRARDANADTLIQMGTGLQWHLTGVPGDSSFGNNHPNAWWCTSKMRDSLQAALCDFYDWSADPDSGWGYNVSLGVNDMSLAWGGGLDIKGHWGITTKLGGHVNHRVGLSVDIDNYNGELKVLDPTDKNHKRKILSPIKGAKLQAIMLGYGGTIVPENPIHFGFFGVK